MFRIASVALTFGYQSPAVIADPSPVDEAFEPDECSDCPHRSHVGQCVAGVFTVCGCDHEFDPAFDPCCDQVSCPTSPAAIAEWHRESWLEMTETF